MSLRTFGWPELEFLLLSLRWTLALSLIAFVGGGLLGAGVAALRVSRSW
ncbi:MAG: amino acid ABC transporter permease, partial [Acetobacteraceae bacterium]|nr:amino acid ABC transporter permease [Acetobacteraceae bacterium]